MRLRCSPGNRLLALVLLLCADRAFALQSLVEQGVTVEYEPRDGDVARSMPEVVRRSGEELKKKLGLRLPEEVRVRLLRRGEAFLGIADGEPVELYAGVAYPPTGTIHVDVRRFDRVGGAHGLLRTVRHECVHLAAGHTLGQGRLPKWFEEGLACRFGSPLPSSEIERLGPGRAYRLSTLVRFPRTREGLRLAYAQVEAVVIFLARERGAGALRDVLRRVGEGEGFDEALLAATGFTVESLDESWRNSLAPPFGPAWGWRLVTFLFSPVKVLLWAALVTVVGYFVVKRRRRRQAESLDDY